MTKFFNVIFIIGITIIALAILFIMMIGINIGLLKIVQISGPIGSLGLLFGLWSISNVIMIVAHRKGKIDVLSFEFGNHPYFYGIPCFILIVSDGLVIGFSFLSLIVYIITKLAYQHILGISLSSLGILFVILFIISIIYQIKNHH